MERVSILFRFLHPPNVDSAVPRARVYFSLVVARLERADAVLVSLINGMSQSVRVLAGNIARIPAVFQGSLPLCPELDGLVPRGTQKVALLVQSSEGSNSICMCRLEWPIYLLLENFLRVQAHWDDARLSAAYHQVIPGTLQGEDILLFLDYLKWRPIDKK